MSGTNDSSSSVVAVSDIKLNNLLAELDGVLPHTFGDFGGALSWAVPWDTQQQMIAYNAARSFLESYAAPGLGVLDHLKGDLTLATDALRDPAKALESLIRSPRGQALGQAVQTAMGSVATQVSVDEHALAAVQLVLDASSIQHPNRNIIADYDFIDSRHWGATASTVLRHFERHLHTTGVCSVAMAGLSAYTLLARRASVYLIKDLPDNVRYGGAAWVNLAVAAAAIETVTPGKVLNMTFAQVMLSAENAELFDPDVLGLAQTFALIDWGLINGLLKEKEDEGRTETELNTVRDEFQRQLKERLEASEFLNAKIPTRKEIALAKLKERFSGNVPFEERLFYNGASVFINGGKNDLHSLLDIAMLEGPRNYTWKTEKEHVRYLLPAINAPLDLGVVDEFNARFDTAIGSLKQGTLFTLKYLISQLPLRDRENLEYGKIDFFQSKIYKLGIGLWGRELTATDPVLTLRVERNGEVTLYSINSKNGIIAQRYDHPGKATEKPDPHKPSLVHAIERFESEVPLIGTVSHSPLPTPKSYSSERTRLIAQTFVNHLDLDNESILQAARGQTTSDQQKARIQAAVDFVLNLIPFKSAISSFIKGDYIDGAMDLFMDVLGFVTAGASIVAKLAQLATRTASALSQTLRAARIIGTFVISELNPLSAFLAAGHLLGKGLVFVGVKGLRLLKKLRGAGRGTDLLLAMNKQRAPVMVGTFKIGEQSMEGVGVLRDGNWYHYNAKTDRLYGAPIDLRPTIGRLALGGFANKDLARLAVKPSDIAGLTANAKGIFRSADGQRFFIRNIDATGNEAIYRIRNDFTLSGDMTDVVIVDPATDRVQGSRIRRVAADQWEPMSARGGDLPSGAVDVPAGTIVEESASLANQSVHTSTNPLNRHSAFSRERLPNGLWKPVIETVSAKQTAHLPFDWGRMSQVRYSFERTNIHEALSTPALSRLTVSTELLDPLRAGYSPEIATKLARKDGGAEFMFVMERVQPADIKNGEFNALKIHDPKVDGLPKQANAVSGYWAPQGGYVDVPIHPAWDQPDHLFTPGFSGCSLVVDQMDATRLRVRHVEGAKELAQYNDLAREEHGLGLSTSMEFHEYGLRVDKNGNADSILTGVAFMRYDRSLRTWTLHFQSSQGAASIMKFSSVKSGWLTKADTLAMVYSDSKVVKVVARPVPTHTGRTAG